MQPIHNRLGLGQGLFHRIEETVVPIAADLLDRSLEGLWKGGQEGRYGHHQWNKVRNNDCSQALVLGLRGSYQRRRWVVVGPPLQ